MGNAIKIRVKTLANLFVGGNLRPFEIGGIDQWTAVDEEGFPCIPASSWKGAIRAIVQADDSDVAKEIAQWYEEMLEAEKQEAQKWIEKLCSEERQRDYQEEKERIEKRYTEAIDAASACYLFGIREFNNTPKLLFNDLRLREECRDLKKCFSIDAKTSIDCSGTEPKSNPRIYKAVRKGMEFEGEIEFYHFDEEICQKCKRYLIQNLEKFNDGIYRLGGSKSRGYGKIHVSVLEDGREDSEEL